MKPGSKSTEPGPRRSAQARSPAAGPSVEALLDRLAAQIERLQVDYRRFFAGELQVPPEELRDNLQRQLRALQARKLSRTVDRFRLANLEAQMSSYGEMFNRQLRQRELGRTPQQIAAPERTGYDPEAGVVLGPSPPPEAVEALFAGLAARGAAGRMDLEGFQSYVGRQLEQLRERTGCERIQFRVAVDDGKVRLKAKPIR